MKVIAIIILVVWLLFLGGTKITLYPFSISMEYWWKALGWLLMILGMVILTVGEYHRGRMKGYGEGVDKCIELLDKKIKEEKK